MAIARIIGITLFFNNLGNCEIGDEDCEYLSRGKFLVVESGPKSNQFGYIY